jgi:hypothetical protein
MEKKISDQNRYVAIPPPPSDFPGARMNEREKLLEAWDQLVKAISQKEGLSGDQAVQHVKKHFPELYDLYRRAKKEKQTRGS